MRLQSLFQEMENHLLRDERPSDYLNEIKNNGQLLEYPFSMLANMERTEQSPVFHPEGNVWIHTMLVVDEAAKIRNLSAEPVVLMWSALLHDIGKPCTTRLRKGRITSYNHDTAGEIQAREFLTFFQMEKSRVRGICAMVRYHMHILYVGKGLSYADMKGMIRRVDPKELAFLGLCDRLGRTNQDPQKEAKAVQEFLSRCRDYAERGSQKQYGR